MPQTALGMLRVIEVEVNCFFGWNWNARSKHMLDHGSMRSWRHARKAPESGTAWFPSQHIRDDAGRSIKAETIPGNVIGLNNEVPVRRIFFAALTQRDGKPASFVRIFMIGAHEHIEGG